MKLELKTSLLSIADLFLPRYCVVCGKDLVLEEQDICSSCFADLPFTRFEKRRNNPMADQFNSLFDEGPYSYACALIYYRENYRRITPALKYRRNFSAGRHFASMLGEKLAASTLFADVDCIIPVPLHWTRRLRRGYNQAEVIAREIAACYHRSTGGSKAPEVRTDILRRCRRTATQTRLDADQKAANVAGAFRCRKPDTLPQHILLVDDVFTTGRTMCACLLALREQIPADVRISAATICYLE